MLYQQKNFMTFWGMIRADGKDGIKQTFLKVSKLAIKFQSKVANMK